MIKVENFHYNIQPLGGVNLNIWELDKLVLFLFFFVPGFIALKVHDLCTPTERRDFSKAWFDAVVYSSFFACIGIGGYRWGLESDIFNKFPSLIYLWFFLTLFIFPIIAQFLLKKLMNCDFFSSEFIHPIPKAWDYVFKETKKQYWIIVHLKDRRQIGGFYGENSFTSSYPAKEQIYLEEAWRLEEGKFVEKIGRTGGIILTGDEIVAVELFELEEVNIDGQA